MFARYRKLKNGKIRIQIVENYRVNNKVVQKVLRHVGTAQNEEELKDFTKMAEHIKETLENELRPSLFSIEELPEKVEKNRMEQTQMELQTVVNLSNIREEKRIITGFHEIYGSLFDQVGYDKVLQSKKTSAKVFKDIVMARLAKPVSKRSSCQMLTENFGIEHELGHIYRMMDAIKSDNKNSKKEVVKIDKIPEIQDISFQYSKELSGGKISLYFYDCTTLYFESFTEDDLRRFGYSKDHKFNQGQVLLALMVSNGGLPIGYDLFAGNMFEGDTFLFAINKLKERYKPDEAVIVADSALLSTKNIEIIIKSGYKYILGARLKNLTKIWQEKILKNTEFETQTIYYKDNAGEVKNTLKIKDYDYSKDKRLIVSRSSARAAKDKHDRNKAMEKLQLKLKKSTNPSDLISNFGYKKYLKIDGESKVSLNEEKITTDSLWDGLHGVFTNTEKTEMNAFAVLNEYHGLWQVEESFRIGKHDIRLRPVFHWNPNRIKAHIAICYTAFSLVRFLQHIIKQQTKELFSARKISLELNSVQQSILYDIKDNKKKYVIPSKSSEDVLTIYKAMGKHRSTVPYKLRE